MSISDLYKVVHGGYDVFILTKNGHELYHGIFDEVPLKYMDKIILSIDPYAGTRGSICIKIYV